MKATSGGSDGVPGACRWRDGAPLTPLLCVLLPQFDPGNTGFISTGKFRSLLDSHSSKLDPHKREVLLALADSHANGQICYQDFVNLVSTLGPSPLGVACLGAWLRGPFWIINYWDWCVFIIEKLQDYGSSKVAAAVPALTPSDLTPKERRGEELFLWELPHEAWDFLPSIGLDWVSGMC